jgi:hypothetical protein
MAPTVVEVRVPFFVGGVASGVDLAGCKVGLTGCKLLGECGDLSILSDDLFKEHLVGGDHIGVGFTVTGCGCGQVCNGFGGATLSVFIGIVCVVSAWSADSLFLA